MASAGEKTYRFFALEADRNTVPVVRSDLRQTSWLRKILAYRKIAAQNLYKSHLGLPMLLVLTVATNETHMVNIMSLVGEMSREGKNRMFLFKTMTSVGDFKRAPEPTGSILSEPWQRVGHEALPIDKP
jgi:hypothetical protein